MPWYWIAISVLLAPDGAAEPECAGCHLEIAAQHEGSRHRVAWTNALFTAEYDDHPKAWCVSCHAPGVREMQRASPPAADARPGVTCSACHVDRGRVVSRARSPRSLHDTRVDPDFGRADDCARCHQFNFPELETASGALLSYTAEPMQNTVAEARALSGPKADCAGCHVDRASGHRFRGSHDRAMVAQAAELTLCAEGDRVTVAVRNRGAGHNLPTGGVHRFLSARLWRSSSPRHVVELRLGRRFGHATGGRRTTIEDTTIAPGKSRSITAELASLGGTRGEPLNLELRYHYSLGGSGTLSDSTPATRVIERRRVELGAIARCAQGQLPETR